MISQARAAVIALDWAEFMQIDAPFNVQVGSFERLTEEAKWAQAGSDHAWGITIGNRENTSFIVGINENTPESELERVIVHELVHVHTFAQSGADERAAMETATELAAQLVMQLREKSR